MHTLRVTSPASPLEQLRAGLEGPAPSSLVRLHDLAAWLDDALQLRDRARAELTVRQVLLERTAATIYGMHPGLAPMVLPVDGAVPASPGRRVLSRGLDGPAARPAAAPQAIGPGNPPQRAWALQCLQLEVLAVNRATASALFDYPAPAREVATAAAPAVSPLRALRLKVDSLQPLRRAEGQQRWPGGLPAACARLLEHYETCRSIPGVAVDDVLPELARLWGLERDTVERYIKNGRKANKQASLGKRHKA